MLFRSDDDSPAEIVCYAAEGKKMSWSPTDPCPATIMSEPLSLPPVDIDGHRDNKSIASFLIGEADGGPKAPGSRPVAQVTAAGPMACTTGKRRSPRMLGNRLHEKDGECVSS